VNYFYFIIFLILGCSTINLETPSRPVLADQVLTVRKGHTGLTHSRCNKYDGEECKDFNIIDYDLDDESFRSLANDLRFQCRIGSELFKICKDKPGFCQIKCKKKWLRKEKCWENKYVSIEPMDYHLSMGTTCQR